jgi:hypothetical protein
MNTASGRADDLCGYDPPGPGVSRSAEYCFRRYISETQSVFRERPCRPGARTAETLTLDRNAQARAMAAISSGPWAAHGGGP